LDLINALVQFPCRLEAGDFLQLLAGHVDHIMHAVPLMIDS
jgi:hypothetical protein